MKVPKISLNIQSIYNIAWIIYCVIPLFFLSSDRDSNFAAIYLIISSIFWVLGQYVAMTDNLSLHRFFPGFRIPSISIINTKVILLVAVLCSGLVVVYNLGDISYLLAYRYNNADIARPQSSFVSSLPFFAIGLYITWMTLESRTSNLLGRIALLLTASIWMIFGLRNIASMLLLSAFYNYFHGKLLRVTSLVLLLFSAYGLASFVAVFREYSIESLGQSDKLAYIFDQLNAYIMNYNNTEFGTTFRSIEYTQNITFDYPILKSFLVDPIVNLIPQNVYPDRPPPISVVFSQAYFNSEDLNQGLGFSLIAESILSMDFLFFIPIFFAGYVVAKISKYESIVLPGKNPKLWQRIWLTSFAGAALNLMRIDFATYAKFIILPSVFGLLALIFILRSNSKCC